MFKSIQRFFHNLFWKEKRIVKEDPKRNNFVGVQQQHQSNTKSNMDRETAEALARDNYESGANWLKAYGYSTPLDVNDHLIQEGFLTLQGAVENLAEAEKSGREDIIHAAKIEMTLTTLNANGFTISRSQMNQAFEAGFDLAYFDDAGIDPDLVISRLANVGVVIETESPTVNRPRNELFVEGEIGYPIANPSAKPSAGVTLISLVPDEQAGDETYALESEHVMSQEAANMYRRLCNLKHHPDFQTPEARLNLGGMLSALRSGSWEPGTGKVLDENSPVIQRLLGGGLQRGHLHILSARTDPSKSQFHSSNNLQSEVNHLIAMDPGKFGAESHAEVDMVVKKLGDEIDCRITKVKVVKARLKPLSKSEKSKMSKRRVKKESKKVLEPSRGKHRG